MAATPVNPLNILTNQVGGFTTSKGPHIASFNLDFTGVGDYLLDLTSNQQNGYFGIPLTVFIDNSTNPNPVNVIVQGTGQTFYAPAYSNGFYQIAASNTARIEFQSNGGASKVDNIQIFDFQIPPVVYSLTPAGVGTTVNILDGGSVTLGTKADAAVTNPATAATEMAVLKGILTDLNTLVKPTIVWTQTVVTLVAGVSNNFLAANANRRALRYMNVGNNPCTIAPGAGAVTVGNGFNYSGAAGGAGFQGGSDVFNDDTSTQAFSAISTTGTTLIVWEGI